METAESISPRIRIASAKDVYLLIDIGSKTFLEAYGSTHSKKDMSTYLKKTFNKEQILEGLGGKAIFLIATFKRKVVGYAKLIDKKKPSLLKRAKAIELERIYVLKKMVGKDVGGALMKKCLSISKSRGYKTIWLSVWENTC